MKKHRLKNTLRAMAKHIGLKIVFVSYFPADVHGRLLVREKRILINAHKPRTEHIYTVLHEIAHYLLHVLNPNRKHHPRIFDRDFRLEFLARISSVGRRYFRYLFNRTAGREWEADLWAMCAFIYFAGHKKIGCRDELTFFLERHPDKWKFFLLGCAGMGWVQIKTGWRKLSELILLPFKTF